MEGFANIATVSHRPKSLAGDSVDESYGYQPSKLSLEERPGIVPFVKKGFTGAQFSEVRKFRPRDETMEYELQSVDFVLLVTC
jgi:hypothetical protein